MQADDSLVSTYNRRHKERFGLVHKGAEEGGRTPVEAEGDQRAVDDEEEEVEREEQQAYDMDPLGIKRDCSARRRSANGGRWGRETRP